MVPSYKFINRQYRKNKSNQDPMKAVQVKRHGSGFIKFEPFVQTIEIQRMQQKLQVEFFCKKSFSSIISRNNWCRHKYLIIPEVISCDVFFIRSLLYSWSIFYFREIPFMGSVQSNPLSIKVLLMRIKYFVVLLL